MPVHMGGSLSNHHDPFEPIALDQSIQDFLAPDHSSECRVATIELGLAGEG